MADGNPLTRVRRPRMPPKLYDLCVVCVKDLFLSVNNSKWHRKEMLSMPQNIFVDLYFTISMEVRWVIEPEMWDLDMLERVLKDCNERYHLYQCFQKAVYLNVPVASILSENYRAECGRLSSSHHSRDSLIELGLRLGTFLNEVGWYTSAQDVLVACRNLCQNAPRTTYYTRMTLECCHRLLHAQASYCSFSEASETLALSVALLEETCHNGAGAPLTTFAPAALDNVAWENGPGAGCEKRAYCRLVDAATPPPAPTSPALAHLMLRLYREFALLHFLHSDYRQTYHWSSQALRLLQPDTPVKITVDVLRICGKACVMMREFGRAGMLMREAVALARQSLGTFDPRYSLTLLDYGFYLLNVDSILDSVTVYEEALATLEMMFKGKNLVLAVAHEDLSYALYVHEYSSGHFFKARSHADKAICIMESLLPPTHLLLSTAKRVKALILEEIALDTPPNLDAKATKLLADSENLHQAALALSLMAFGEMNVQTAKHYGNLGRLYQSMQKYEEAERMQLRAISIKEKLLGADDYEVGLSVGHLASLYNYHMNMYSDAEVLYFRSININLKLFGERYSGLEYDYMGLVHVYNELNRPEDAVFYTQILLRWRALREQPLQTAQPVFGREVAVPIPQLKRDFFRQD